MRRSGTIPACWARSRWSWLSRAAAESGNSIYEVLRPMNTTVVILAAGLGTRMRSKRAKVLHRAGGLSLVEHVVHAAQAVAPRERIVVVTGHQADTVEALLGPMGVRFARQVQQKGTGHPRMCARGQPHETDPN